MLIMTLILTIGLVVFLSLFGFVRSFLGEKGFVALWLILFVALVVGGTLYIV